ncbi:MULTISPECIES: siderophore-interacting protein [unclassified Pseudomonas]|uniref:siderophore-interacting protein n=1 Tax=unclassified Pseudomonas TaxID=196821 RepID=UPI001473D769|nr:MULTISPECIES: siderophore-interacting protein [unclassified Pseudomonas]NMY37085.1 siderophore-interacting protein [Pseudomonas sp. WS 5078]NMY59599.1 siderophore-interacting protein [Pseudomonas sp. WS 5354]
MSVAATLVHALRKRLSKPGGYELFDIRLKQRIALSPSLMRFVFTGDEVGLMQILAPDQRVKLFFPSTDGTSPCLPNSGDWQAARRALSAEKTPPMRTYTLRNLRPDAHELDIDFVLHGETGPASRWAMHCQPGDRLQIVAPHAAYRGDPGGYEWQPPHGVRHVLLIGDETALPALAGILEQLADHPDAPHVQAFIEVPEEADCLPLLCGLNAKVHWLPRASLGKRHGEGMILAARELASLPPMRAALHIPTPVEALDLNTQRPWERASAKQGDFYAWIAGESAAVMAIRQFLINEQGLARQQLTLMGYWKQGRSLE